MVPTCLRVYVCMCVCARRALVWRRGGREKWVRRKFHPAVRARTQLQRLRSIKHKRTHARTHARTGKLSIPLSYLSGHVLHDGQKEAVCPLIVPAKVGARVLAEALQVRHRPLERLLAVVSKRLKVRLVCVCVRLRALVITGQAQSTAHRQTHIHITHGAKADNPHPMPKIHTQCPNHA